MNISSINYIAVYGVAIAVIAILVIGYLWYSKPVFLMRYLKGPSKDEGSLKKSNPMNESIAKVFLGVSNVIFGVLLLPSFCLAFASLFFFDAQSVPTWIILLAAISGMSSPLVIIISLVLSRSIYKKQRYVLAVIVSLAPLLNIGGLFLSDALMRPYFPR